MASETTNPNLSSLEDRKLGRRGICAIYDHAQLFSNRNSRSIIVEAGVEGSSHLAMSGVQFPEDASGRRTSTQPAKDIWSKAFAGVDEDGVEALSSEKNWRQKYQIHAKELTRKSVRTPELTLKVAQQGLDAVYETFDFVRDGESCKLDEALRKYSGVPTTATIKSEGKRVVNLHEAFSVPCGSKIASGDELIKTVQNMLEKDYIEPDVLDALKDLLSSGEEYIKALKDTYFVILGATSELCPLEPLLEMGLNVVAVARPNESRQRRLIQLVQNAPEGASLTVPIIGEVADKDKLEDPDYVASMCGADILTHTPELANWLESIFPGKRLVIGSYIYLDGADHVRASVAMDAVLKSTIEKRPDTSLTYLGTPALLYTIPKAAWEASQKRQKNGRSLWQSAMSMMLGPFEPANNPPVVADSINEDAVDKSKEIYVFDGIVTMQGPNYLLAKTLQNWRAMVAREVNKCVVSVNMAPASRTDSVMHVATVARAIRGLENFPPLTSFEPGTARSMMALLLIHDLGDKNSPANPDVVLRNPLELFASYGVHSGLWRAPYSQESLGKSLYVSSFFSSGPGV